MNEGTTNKEPIKEVSTNSVSTILGSTFGGFLAIGAIIVISVTVVVVVVLLLRRRRIGKDQSDTCDGKGILI